MTTEAAVQITTGSLLIDKIDASMPLDQRMGMFRTDDEVARLRAENERLRAMIAAVSKTHTVVAGDDDALEDVLVHTISRYVGRFPDTTYDEVYGALDYTIQCVSENEKQQN